MIRFCRSLISEIQVPYLRNCWYAATYANDVGDTPFARQLLGEFVVLFRTSDGVAHALEDRCPHRFAPLSMGTVVEDQLQCPYHGLRFGTDGACSYNPHYAALPKIPENSPGQTNFPISQF